MFENQDEHFLDLQVDNEAANAILETAKWTPFIGIVLFVITAITVLVLLLAFGSLQNDLGNLLGTTQAPPSIMLALMVPVIGFIFLVAFLLYRFGTLSRQAIFSQDQRALDRSLKALKNFFLICGLAGLLGLLGSVIGMIGNIS